MSRKKKTMMKFVKFVRAWRGCHHEITYQGFEVDSATILVVLDAFSLWFCVIRDVLCVSGVDANEGRLRKVMNDLTDFDVFSVLKSLDDASGKLLESVLEPPECMESYNTLTLRDAEQSEGLVSLGCLLAPFVRRWLRHNDEDAFRRLREVYEFLKRLTISHPEIAKTSFDGWFEVEQSWNGVVPVPCKEIAQEWFPIEDVALISEYFSPHHGSGAVKEGRLSLGEKYLLNGWDSRINVCLTELQWEKETPLLMQEWFHFSPVAPSNCHSVAAVPKSYKVYRVVSPEPVAYQFFEEGGMQSIFRYLRGRHSDISRHYCVDTEHWNREGARRGSIDGSFATIDLSHASDSVSEYLVEYLLGETCLYPLLNLRTEFAHFRNGDIIQVHKFAPMGSALCFPIETIVFCLITEWCVRKTPGADPRFWVYGDDIVCDSLIADLLMETLRTLGFDPNVSKSFFNRSKTACRGFFRESCGAEYLNGIDVAPKRLSRKFTGIGFDTDRSLPQLISMANDLFDRKTAREYILYELLDVSKLPILFDWDGLRGIKSSNPTNDHLDRRYNSAYQRDDVFAITLARVERQDPYYKELTADYLQGVRLFEYLRIAESMQRTHCVFPEDAVTAHVEPFSLDTVATLGWVYPPDPSAP